MHIRGHGCTLGEMSNKKSLSFRGVSTDKPIKSIYLALLKG